jgi:hypothetical protein
MTKDEALAFHGELEALLGRVPGGMDDQARRQLSQIRFAFQTTVPALDAYLREKVNEACGSLDTWLSPRKWQRWGEDPKVFQRIVYGDVYKVRRAIDTAFREQAGGPHGPTQ